MSEHNNSPTGKYQSRPPQGADCSNISGPISKSDKPSHRLTLDSHELPYIEVHDRTEVWKATPPSDPTEWADEAYRLNKHAVERGERIFNLTLDQRFGHTCTESELERWTFFLAHAMAVSAGFTSHGQNSRKINRHGPSRV